MKTLLTYLLWTLIVVTVLMAAMFEILAFMPLPGWFYLLCIVVLAGAGLALRTTQVRLAILAGALLLGCLHLVPWSSRKPFLRDLARVKPGMSIQEVRSIMARYVEGTGWPANPFATDGEAVLQEAGTDRKFSTRANDAGEMEIQNSIVFRHNPDDGRFNSDWGVVKFQNSRVVNVSFLPD
ncbi:MAG: hypothetical protein KIS67_15410 [Verrucomicrobiae bacterium]|nr:hypothetical protein [Verrucomicrobiae bacterium]